MKRILLAGAALLGLIGTASAADLPRPMPAPAVAPAVVPYSNPWTGFYVGAGWGYGVSDTNSTVVAPGGALQGTTNNGARGWLGMADVGYDYQFNVAGWNLVAGVLADYNFGNMTGTSNFQAASGAGFNTLTGVEKENSFWDVGGRIGWLVTPDILSYFSGGYSDAHFQGMNFALAGVPMSTSSHNYGGWFTGAGIETRVASIPGLYFNTEYRFTSYDNATLAVANSGASAVGTFSLKQQPSQQTVMSGLHYKFNWQ